MTEQEARTRMIAGLSEIYGIQEGIRMAGTVVPGIMNDFKTLIRKEQIREEYRLEDGRAVVLLSGKALKDGTVSFDVVRVERV
jgi:hypothetical protein